MRGALLGFLTLPASEQTKYYINTLQPQLPTASNSVQIYTCASWEKIHRGTLYNKGIQNPIDKKI